MLSCKEYATALSSGELEGAGLARRLAAAYHWAICKYCRAYTRQLRAIGRGARRLLRREPSDPEALARLERQLVERCSTSPGQAEDSTTP